MRAEDAAVLFDAHAARYDQVNRIVSLGIEQRWRRWVARRAVRRPGDRVLDGFAGTGAVGLEASRLGAEVTLADVSLGMLAVAERRSELTGTPARVVHADLVAADLPFTPATFDAVTAVFATRYLDDPVAVLSRLARLLAPGGRLVVMEFVEPGPGLVRTVAGAYFFRVLPRIAATLAGSPELYRYLADSTHRLGTAADFDAIVRATGLAVVEAADMGFGLVRGLVAAPSEG